jgi:hypothetical protein
MATQLETLRLVAPEFASVDDVTVQAMLDIAPLIIDPLLYSEEVRGLALVYQACILLAQRQASSNGTASAGGTLVREKEGDLERQFSAGTSTNGAASKNQYELMLDKLSMNISSGAITRMADWINGY